MAQKESKRKHSCLGKEIRWELCKRLKLDNTHKWYLHKQESVLENERHKILWDFEIQTDCSIPVRRPNQVSINKKEKKITWCGSCPLCRHRVKIKAKKQISESCQRSEELVEHEGEDDTNNSWCTRNNPQCLEKFHGEQEIRGRIKTIQTTALLKLPRILARVLKT